MGALFFTSMSTFMAPFMMTTQTFQGERPVFLREQANKMYDVTPYFLSKVVTDLPGFILGPTFFIAISYFAIGYNNDGAQFAQFLLIGFMNTYASVTVGYFSSCLFNNVETALAMAPVLAMPMALVGGMFANMGTLPIYFEIFSYISPIMYAMNGFTIL